MHRQLAKHASSSFDPSTRPTPPGSAPSKIPSPYPSALHRLTLREQPHVELSLFAQRARALWGLPCACTLSNEPPSPHASLISSGLTIDMPSRWWRRLRRRRLRRRRRRPLLSRWVSGRLHAPREVEPHARTRTRTRARTHIPRSCGRGRAPRWGGRLSSGVALIPAFCRILPYATR